MGCLANTCSVEHAFMVCNRGNGQSPWGTLLQGGEAKDAVQMVQQSLAPFHGYAGH